MSYSRNFGLESNIEWKNGTHKKPERLRVQQALTRFGFELIIYLFFTRYIFNQLLLKIRHFWLFVVVVVVISRLQENASE